MKNPFPPRLKPEFITYKDNLQRGLAIWRGHESIVINREDLTPGDGLRAGDFGISDDEWVFAIRDSSHVAICRVSSRVLNGRLLTTPDEVRATVKEIWKGKRPGPQELSGALDFCTGYPASVDDVRSSVGGECSFQLSGKCFPGESTILGGEPVVLALDKVFMAGPPSWWTSTDESVVRAYLIEFYGLWDPLESWFLEQSKKTMNAVLELPRQCEHCHGAGTVPK